MANFPNSVTVYTTRNPGDVIPSADWDSFGAEITAIEDGLINGTAPLHSSNATFNTLTTSTGATIGGTLTVSSNLTVTGTPSIAGRIACIVTHSTSQNTNTGAATGLDFDTNVYNPHSMHDAIINSSRIKLTSSGLYLIGADIQWSNSTAGSFRILDLRINDASVLPPSTVPPFTTVGTAHRQHVSLLYQTASTSDWVTVVVTQDSGSTMSISSGPVTCRFWATMVGV